MSSIPPFIKDPATGFNYERQIDKSPSDKGPATCRVLKKGLGNNIWFTQFYWPFGGEPITTTRIDICGAWITLRNERDRLWSILKACEEVNQRKMWRKDCTNDQVAEIRGIFEAALWTFQELDLFIEHLERYQSHNRTPHWLIPVPPHHPVLDLRNSPFRLKPKTMAHELSTLPLVIVYQLGQVLDHTRRVPSWYEGVRKLYPETWRENVGLPAIETGWSRWIDHQRQLELEARRGPTLPPRKKSFMGMSFSKSSAASSSSTPVRRPPSPTESATEKPKGQPPPYTP